MTTGSPLTGPATGCRRGPRFPRPGRLAAARTCRSSLAGLALFYGLLSLTHYWAGPVNAQPEIRLTPAALPKYALFSVARIADRLSAEPGRRLVYGYVAAHNATRRADHDSAARHAAVHSRAELSAAA